MDASADSLYLAMRLQERADDLSSQIQEMEKRKKKIESFIMEAESVCLFCDKQNEGKTRITLIGERSCPKKKRFDGLHQRHQGLVLCY